MPHHWYNVARAEQDGRERVAAERGASDREIARLRRELELKDQEIASLQEELGKLRPAASRIRLPVSKARGRSKGKERRQV
jgi:hypothetical protein